MRNVKISCDISTEAKRALEACCEKNERSQGYLIDKMIKEFCCNDVELSSELSGKTIDNTEVK